MTDMSSYIATKKGRAFHGLCLCHLWYAAVWCCGHESAGRGFWRPELDTLQHIIPLIYEDVWEEIDLGLSY